MTLTRSVLAAHLFACGTVWAAETRDLGVELSYTQDNNVSRGDGAYKYSDSILTASVNYTWRLPVTDRTRLVIQPVARTQRYQDFDGLTSNSAGINIDYQWRPQGGFHAPTLSLIARWNGENFNNDQRDGTSQGIGISTRSLLTDRIGLYGALLRNERDADNVVFDTETTVVKLNLDYEITRRVTAYFGIEQQKGDTLVSTPYAGVIGLAADVDGAFPGSGLYTYRFDGKTQMFTLGFNVVLNEQHALDFSLRLLDTSAIPGYDYKSKQLAFAYLGRF